MDSAPVLAVLAVLVALWLVLIAALVVSGRGPLARELAALVPNLARLFAGLLGDPRVPRRAKIVLGLAAGYLAMPIDLIPDFIPIAGALDDAIVAALALRYVTRVAPAEVLADHWHGDPATLARLLRAARR